MAVVALVLHTKVLVPVPPVAEAVADPLLPPLQLTFVELIEATTAAGSVTVTVVVSVQPLLSVTVTV